MKQLKKLLTVSFFVLAMVNCIAQTEDKDVAITASGSGATQEAAKQAALRSAIEQAYGAFISTKTEMLNDQVLADEMVSVSSGNIKSYELLNQDSFPDGRWGLTLKAVVSIDKLSNFVESKGGAVEIKGGMFALNIKQQMLNEQGEKKAVADMVGLLHEPMQTAFDYSIISGMPQSLDAESKNWGIPLKVSATCNKNMDFCADYLIKTLTALSLTSDEVTSYRSLNKEVFGVTVDYNGKIKTLYLRTRSSIYLLNSFTSNWEFYTRSFSVQSDIDEINVEGSATIHEFSKDYLHSMRTINNCTSKTIKFLTLGQEAATFSWRSERTLAQVEQMTGYTVKPRGVFSEFRNGGYVIYEENGHGLVALICDIGMYNWSGAKVACDELVMSGYNDWYLPSMNEFKHIDKNMHRLGLGMLSTIGYDAYWTSDSGDSGYEGITCRLHGLVGAFYDEPSFEFTPYSNSFMVRPVRAF